MDADLVFVSTSCSDLARNCLVSDANGNVVDGVGGAKPSLTVRHNANEMTDKYLECEQRMCQRLMNRYCLEGNDERFEKLHHRSLIDSHHHHHHYCR